MTEPSPSPPLSTQRLPGIDALRVWGTLLVVLLHAGLAYVPEPMPGLFWPVDNVDGSPAVAELVWSIEAFIMPLFFVISGISAGVLLSRKGADPLLRNRWDRILKPLLVVGPFILLAEFYIWNLGDAIRGDLPWSRLTRFKASAYNPEVWGTAHLWYLQYLFLYALIVWVFSRLKGGTGSSPASEPRRFALPPALLIVLVALLAAPMLYCFPEIVTSFDHRFWPVPKRFAYFAIYFFGGMLLTPALGRGGKSISLPAYGLVILGAVALLPTVGVIRQLLRHEPVDPAWMTACLTAAGVGLGLGLPLIATLSRRELGPTMQSLGAASYWVYLVHHPLCGGVNLLLDRVDLPASVKFLATSVIVLALCLGSFFACVRNTRLEGLLNGRKASEKLKTPPG